MGLSDAGANFELIASILIVLAILAVVILGLWHRGTSGTAGTEHLRRDVIAEGAIDPDDVTRMLELENSRLRQTGRTEYGRPEFEARLVGDPAFRRRLLIQSRVIRA